MPPELRAKLESLLRAEIAQVMDDWRLRRQWFVKADNPITNQWVLPNEGAMLDMLAVCGSYLASREAVWAMRNLFDGPPDKLEGLFCRATPASTQAPPLFAAYERATRVNWRDNWDDNGSAVWVRGGHADDQHDHKDRGHVNFIHQGRCILIEAGTPAYHNPRIHTHYSTGLGHNVLQIGDAPPPASPTKRPPGWQKARTVAPIQVHRLDAAGGEVTVDATAGYDDLERWRREVKWTADKVEVRDDIALAGAKAEHILFRWHLGTRNPVDISGQDGKWYVSWPDATIAIESATSLQVTQEQLPDHTLEERKWEECGDDRLHACVIVRTTTPVTSAGIVTRVVARLPAANAGSNHKKGSTPRKRPTMSAVSEKTAFGRFLGNGQ